MQAKNQLFSGKEKNGAIDTQSAAIFQGTGAVTCYWRLE
tara:strand:- start:549 stop:665 length:117 start_codon:yes stop_codon:yes gene_type:complete